MKTQVIAIDGYASTGKSTLSKRLATHLGYTYVDTGYMFRAIGLYVLQNNLIVDDVITFSELEKELPTLQFSWVEGKDAQLLMALNGRVYGEELRSTEVSNLVSRVATAAAVRSHLLEQQRKLSDNTSVVMDGRDIGTVVFPNATHKFFLNAKPEIRAERRYSEMQAKGIPGALDEVLANVIERDRIDSTRVIAPLVKAQDAIEIDTSAMDVEAVFQLLCDHIKS
jgi:cytidylate kinase